MDNKLKDIIFLTDYLTNCKLEDPNSEKSELTRKLLTCRVRQVLEERSKNLTYQYPDKKSKKNFFFYLFNIIF